MPTLKAQRFGWYVYDWANSAFSTSVVTVFLGPFLTNLAESAANDAGQVTPFGIPMHPGSWFSYCIAVSVILQVFILPPIGAIVDRSHRKRLSLAVWAFLGAAATIGLAVLSSGSGNYIIGGLFFIIANLSFGASVVVANSFLNDLATPEERDSVSSRGWAFGYRVGGPPLLGTPVVVLRCKRIRRSHRTRHSRRLCDNGYMVGLVHLCLHHVVAR
ncbi:MAG: MFS transporter [Ignavibacteria bacterium]|nr:MFS transporter [Ignavibacteria bacterium]